jgi:hypothetical protein
MNPDGHLLLRNLGTVTQGAVPYRRKAKKFKEVC